MSTNNKISNLVSSQVPFFVRNDHPTFVRFIEAYYEYLEQANTTLASGKTIERAKNLQNYFDIDKTIDDFADKLYLHFLSMLPDNMLADKTIVLKNVQDFYRARGTEKSNEFLFNILFNKGIEFYYPKSDILRASDGKWSVQRKITISDIAVNNVANNNVIYLNSYVNKKIYGRTSNASAVIDSVERNIVGDDTIDVLSISSLKGTFTPGESIYTRVVDGSNINFVSATVVNNTISQIVVTKAGSRYNVGDYVKFESTNVPTVNANAVVSLVSVGDINGLTLSLPGAGFRVGDYLRFIGGSGSGANAEVTSVLSDGSVHSNTYNIFSSLISLEANTPINNTIYANLNTAIVSSPNVNTAIVDALSAFTISGLGPITGIKINSGGSAYLTAPIVDVSSNTRLREMGILGRMEIVNPGLSYVANDKIEFINPTGFPGYGAYGNVRTVSANGQITAVEFIRQGSEQIGGSGYIDTTTLEPKYPVANVVSATGSGAVIRVSALLGDGESIIASNSVYGGIEKITLLNAGSGYAGLPTINLKHIGDGTATAIARMKNGYAEEQGIYLNDDGFLSSYNFLQNRDYYQNYSYVIAVQESIHQYRDILKNLVHAAGMKMLGEYDLQPVVNLSSPDIQVTNVSYRPIEIATFSYLASSNTINVALIGHGLSANDNVYVEFIDTSEFENKYYMVTDASDANLFIITSTITSEDAGSGQSLVYTNV